MNFQSGCHRLYHFRWPTAGTGLRQICICWSKSMFPFFRCYHRQESTSILGTSNTQISQEAFFRRTFSFAWLFFHRWRVELWTIGAVLETVYRSFRHTGCIQFCCGWDYWHFFVKHTWPYYQFKNKPSTSPMCRGWYLAGQYQKDCTHDSWQHPPRFSFCHGKYPWSHFADHQFHVIIWGSQFFKRTFYFGLVYFLGENPKHFKNQATSQCKIVQHQWHHRKISTSPDSVANLHFSSVCRCTDTLSRFFHDDDNDHPSTIFSEEVIFNAVFITPV